MRRLVVPSTRGFDSYKSLIGQWRARRQLSTPLRRALHFAQSAYARDFVRDRLGLESLPLSDYTTVGAHVGRGRAPASVVSYNPAKGGHIVARVKEVMQGPVRWVPLEGMDRPSLEAALLGSDVYLDLGHQPGKDRLPREAAAAGAVAIVLAVGAAANGEDFCLPSEHKIHPGPDLENRVAVMLRRVLDDLPRQFARQEAFRLAVAQERATFQSQVTQATVALGLA